MRHPLASLLLLTLMILGCVDNVTYSEEPTVDRCDRDYWGDDLPASCDLTGATPEPEPEPEPEPNPEPNPNRDYRFVLVEDLSADNANGATPGADVDAIGIQLANGAQLWAESVEDFNIGGANNEHVDVSELLGAPDATACWEPAASLGGFTSLGGIADVSYVMVSFGDTTFSRGDAVIVWELGPTNCGDAQPGWLDDETAIAISASTDLNIFIELGTVGLGSNAILIP